MSRRREGGPIEAAALWLLGHASRLWPFLLLTVVGWLSWHTLRQIHTREFREALHALDAGWVLVAAAITVANVAVMGGYDVIAFRHTRTRRLERWRYGAVAFAWSNFLTLGPLAGPAVRYWLYRPAVDHAAELNAGVVSVALAFASGLAGWTAAVLAGARLPLPVLPLLALLFTTAVSWGGGLLARRTERFRGLAFSGRSAVGLAVIGWLDWLLAAGVFFACMRATGLGAPLAALARQFFLGQALGLASLIPGGFGTSDAYWLTHLPFAESAAAAALVAYRFVYYIGPWALASLLLLAWGTRRSAPRVEVARRSVAGLVGGAGVLIMLSSASPALHARLVLLERYMPLPLVEAGQLAAALAGLLLLVLARGIARGYRTAFRATLLLLLLAAGASILKGLDWEESLVLGLVAIAASSQAAIFDRASRGDRLAGADLAVAFGALALFVVFGVVSHHVTAGALDRLASFGYHLQGPRFLRTAASLACALAAASIYVFIRPRVDFEPPSARDIDDALEFNERYGRATNPLMVANADKSIFRTPAGLVLYRTIGPYLAVFSDPVVRADGERDEFLDALIEFAGGLDRRLLFYQVSLDWVPLLHDRGYSFFKLGEEAQVPLDRVTLDGHAGKETRQVLRRAERDGVRFRVLEPAGVPAVLAELRAISDEWLRAKGVSERQFSIGFFDEEYLKRFRCAVVEQEDPARILAFANLLEGPRREELSIDLMRSRSEGPKVMDFLITSLLLEGKRLGYRRFNLGMAPLAAVGVHEGAHVRERLARVIFQRGEHWYNFQGVRFYKQKFNPEWQPRYLAYQAAIEWPIAAAAVSALVAGGWGSALRPAHDPGPRHHAEAARASA